MPFHLPARLATPCRAPTAVVNDDATTQVGTTIAITPPDGTVLEEFVDFSVFVCPGGTISPPCPEFTCLPGQVSACPITGLSDSKTYTIAAIGHGTAGTNTVASAPDSFETKPYP